MMSYKPAYLQHLAQDPHLKKILVGQRVLKLGKSDNLVSFLFTSIINQQLSSKVGEIFHRRFLDLFGGKEPTTRQVMTIPFSKLREIGLSNSKANYIKNVADFDKDNTLSKAHMESMNDEEVISYITQIKGVGKWTAQMLLMFGLGRTDVFADGDLSIQKAIASLYGLERTDKQQFKEKMNNIADKWKPYRSYACLALWLWSVKDPPVK